MPIPQSMSRQILGKLKSALFSTQAARERERVALSGRCVVCGKKVDFLCNDLALARESLTCTGCQTTSRKQDFPELGILNTELFYCRVKA